MGLPAGVSVSPIDYRRAPEEMLAKYHAVESVVRREERPDRAETPFESFLVEARNLPASIADWTWLAEVDGEVVALAACWHQGAGHDSRVLESEIRVLPAFRRLGIGRALLVSVCDVAEAEGRYSLTWSTSSAVADGESFSRAMGAREAVVVRESHLLLGDVEWDMVDRWVEEGPKRAPEYDLQLIEGPLPAELYEDMVVFSDIMETAPRDDLDVAPAKHDVAEIAEWERLVAATAAAGTEERWLYLARHRGSGECVGGTDVFWRRSEPLVVAQGNTGVHPDHRGHALGKWLKATMLQKIRAERPKVERVRTTNAYSNDPMLGINNELGFREVRAYTAWQADIETVRERLAKR